MGVGNRGFSWRKKFNADSEKRPSFSKPMICCSDLSREAKRKHWRFQDSPVTTLFLSHWKYVSSRPDVTGVPGESQLTHASVGHSRGGLVNQVEKQAVGQVAVQDFAHAPDLICEGLGQEGSQLPDHLSNQRVDPPGDPIPKNEEPRGCLTCSEAEGVSVCVYRWWGAA